MTAPLLERSAEQATLRAAVDRLLSGTSGLILLERRGGDRQDQACSATCWETSMRARGCWPAAATTLSPPTRSDRCVRPSDRPGTIAASGLARGRRGPGERAPGGCAAGPGRRAQRKHPTLLAVEDLHWADDATLDALGYLARRIDQLALLLLLTYRDDETGRSIQCSACSPPPRAG